MKQTVAAYIAKTLESAGVKRIWGVTGDSLNGLSDSLNRMGTIEWMFTRQKSGGALPLALKHNLAENWRSAPDRAARQPALNQRPVLPPQSRSGTGDCRSYSSSEIGSGYFRNPPQELFRECSHYCELVSSPEQIHKYWRLPCAKRCLTVAFRLSCYQATWR